MSNRLKEIKEELETLTWVKWENRFNVKDNQFPGVYVVAKTKNQVEGKKVDIHDIYYVGMTTSRAGLIGRLNQFDSGIKRGYGHSGANRLFKEIKNNIPYPKWNDGERLFVAAIPKKCNVDKITRDYQDLQTMGRIALLEFEILAMIKMELGREPELNKK
ncbi:hypothetical protein J4448_02505 [Candidatus Woesearchaeota archaeon]|nr:hypothetical protein [Candidatus Woesearchaeota archaeon]